MMLITWTIFRPLFKATESLVHVCLIKSDITLMNMDYGVVKLKLNERIVPLQFGL